MIPGVAKIGRPSEPGEYDGAMRCCAKHLG